MCRKEVKKLNFLQQKGGEKAELSPKKRGEKLNFLLRRAELELTAENR